MTRIDYVLTGCANGQPVRIEGKGIATPRRLQVAIRAIEPSLTFDGRLVHVAGLDAVAALVHGLALGRDDPVIARSRMDALLDGAAEVGSIVAHTAIHRRSDGYGCKSQLGEARLAMEVGESITAIDARTVQAVMAGAGVALFSAAAVSTSRGREWTVTTSTLLVGCDPGKRTSLWLKAVRDFGP